jgi:Tfp pilus assembly protein PilN
VRAEARHRGVVTWIAEAGYESLEDLTDTIARLAAEPAERCSRLAVTLERPPVQTRTLTDLPRVKDRELVALVAHQAGRYFRRNGHPLVTDAVWANGEARVALAAAVEEPVVEAIVAGARAAGLILEGIAPADASALLVLLPTSERAARTRVERKLVWRLVLVTASLWVLVIGLVVGRLMWDRRIVERQLASLEVPLATVLAARRELHDADATLQGAAQADRDRSQGLAVLGAITAALPDSAVMTSLTWAATGKGVVTGLARRAAEVLERLQRVGVLPAPRLEGPTVKEAIGGREWERFTIVFGKDPGPP